MKKIITFIALAFGTSLVGQSTFRLENFSTKEAIGNASGQYVTVPGASTHSLFVDVVNTSSGEQTYSVKREDIQLNENGTATATALFCFGENCYTPGVMEAFDPVVLEAGARTSELPANPGVPNMLIAELTEVKPAGLSIVQYTVFNVNNPGDAISFAVRYNDPTAGLSSVNVSKHSLSLAPNPAQGSTSAIISLPVPGKCNISVYDVLGARVSTSDKILPAGQSAVPLSLTSLKPGVYFVSLTTQSGSAVHRLVID